MKVFKSTDLEIQRAKPRRKSGNAFKLLKA